MSQGQKFIVTNLTRGLGSMKDSELVVFEPTPKNPDITYLRLLCVGGKFKLGKIYTLLMKEEYTDITSFEEPPIDVPEPPCRKERNHYGAVKEKVIAYMSRHPEGKSIPQIAHSLGMRTKQVRQHIKSYRELYDNPSWGVWTLRNGHVSQEVPEEQAAQ